MRGSLVRLDPDVTAALVQRLLEPLEPNLTPRDPELDAECVAALGAVVEWRQANYTMESHPVVTWAAPHPLAGMREPLPPLTGSIDAAVGLLRAYLPGFAYRLDTRRVDGCVWVSLFPPGVVAHAKPTLAARGQHEARTLTAAVLRAVAYGWLEEARR